MTRHYLGSQRGQKERNYRKHADFNKHGKANRYAQTQHLSDRLPVGLHPVSKQMKRSVGFTAVEIDEQRDYSYPVGDGGSPATTHATHGWQTELAVDKDVIKRQIEQRTDQRKHHDDARVTEPVGQSPQSSQHQQCGHSPGKSIQVTLRNTCRAHLKLQ